MRSRVLIVEDNPVIRELMLRQLSTFGINCYAVENAEEAVELFEFFDLILMDVQLPGISGIDATRLIRHIESSRGLPPTTIVATTGTGSRSDCLSAGMDDFYRKPVKRPDVERIMNDWLFGKPGRLRLLG